MNHEFELGYTPHNLRLIIRHLKSLGMTQQQIAKKIGASKYTTLLAWLNQSDNKTAILKQLIDKEIDSN